MADQREILNIDACPKCGKSHLYDLDVHRSIVYHHPPSTAQARRFLRLFSCPETGEDFQAEVVLPEKPHSVVEKIDVIGVSGLRPVQPEHDTVRNVVAVSPHNRALYETGKALLVQSLDTARDFCKTMITVSFAAIPVYVGLLGFRPQELPDLGQREFLVALPAVAFLLAGLFFAIGYLPTTAKFSLDIMTEVEAAMTGWSRRRKRMIMIGFSLFLIGTLLAILMVLTH